MITKIYYDLASTILALDANAIVSIQEEDIDRITWVTSEISKSDILAKQTELKAADDALAYARSRAAEYPPMEEQLDKIYNDGIDAWKVVIKATKDKYPKE
jgi:hypothetical protein